MGFGAVLIDQQHGLLDERTAFECVQRLEKFPDCFPIVRVCDNSTALISRALDAGACGKVDTRHHNSDDELHFSRNHRANDALNIIHEITTAIPIENVVNSIYIQ